MKGFSTSSIKIYCKKKRISQHVSVDKTAILISQISVIKRVFIINNTKLLKSAVRDLLEKFINALVIESMKVQVWQ